MGKRSEESRKSEAETRNAIQPFLESRGFTGLHKIKDSNNMHILSGRDEQGAKTTLWVKTCWTKKKKNQRPYAGAQLTEKIPKENQEEALESLLRKVRDKGVSHLLVVQRSGTVIDLAAKIPLNQVLPIWRFQRETSHRLEKEGKLTHRKANHAENGNSPSIWLQEDDAPGLSEALWQTEGVVNVCALPKLISERKIEILDDTFDDLPGTHQADIGTDNPTKVVRQTSGVKRNAKVRQAVIERAGGKCERQGCEVSRDYVRFFDAHHVLGADKSDRPWTCVCLCPNCHREAHFAPHRDELNRELEIYALRFKP